MKTLLLSALLSFSFLQINAQCSENAGNFGNNTNIDSYNVSGNINVVLNNNNTVTINFADNYRTASGPDVRLYFINSNGRSDAQLKSLNPDDVENISFGLVGFSGAQSFTQTIPNNIDITAYDTVFFYCLRFTEFWDYGSYTPFSSANCSVLSTESVELNNISVYPNPASDKIFISNLESNNVQIRIFNVLGKIVHQQKNNLENGISLSRFPKGIYMLQIVSDEKKVSKKIVIE
jgi:hypothetical protein